MSDFKPIKTQDELNKVIKSRIERERKKLENNVKDYSELKEFKETNLKKVETLSKTLAEQKQELENKENELNNFKLENLKTKSLIEANLPLSALKNVYGQTDDEIKASIDNLKSVISNNSTSVVPPKKNPDAEHKGKGANNPYMKMAQQIKEEKGE
jgi:ribosome-binding ATPase YchF (GTP1/OBG family)